ncbi:hypothetical protein [Parafrankia sp. FMc2]|uniref:hypothetical protein n=1 Tax=Parafrankia sp. FMc2 TaxID=3233196 RepID=UPI0034D6828B
MIDLRLSIPERSSSLYRSWERARQEDPKAIGETELQYYLFYVHIVFALDGVEFISTDEVVTLVDFMQEVSWVAENIASHRDASIGFTEHADTVSFRWTKGGIHVSAPRAPGGIYVNPDNLMKTLHAFLENAIACLAREIPGIEDNPTIRAVRHPQS